MTTADDILRRAIGDLVIQIAVLQAQQERLTAEVEQLRKERDSANAEQRVKDMDDYVRNNNHVK